jgi:hypothetical protein
MEQVIAIQSWMPLRTTREAWIAYYAYVMLALQVVWFHEIPTHELPARHQHRSALETTIWALQMAAGQSRFAGSHMAPPIRKPSGDLLKRIEEGGAIKHEARDCRDQQGMGGEIGDHRGRSTFA